MCAWKRRVPKEEKTQHEIRRKKLIDHQNRRCAVCDQEMDTRDAMYEIDSGPGLIVHKTCFFLYLHMKKYKGLTLNRALRLVHEDCNDNKAG
jgi:hypothetical protein